MMDMYGRSIEVIPCGYRCSEKAVLMNQFRVFDGTETECAEFRQCLINAWNRIAMVWASFYGSRT